MSGWISVKMSKEFLEKKEEEARNFIYSLENQRREKKEAIEKDRIQSYVGKFYSDLNHKPDEGVWNVYRVFNKGWHGDGKMERYYYYHEDYYGISISNYHEGISGASPNFDKEIDETTFWHNVSQVLKKIGCLQVIMAEQDH